ncbi:ribonuclease H [Senna tora]|uniref:Ribonuclease H n=1 Tax=Senna tora TaxID=362788 RepID=A0A834T345_9FABA|nr:ribonuclease H [Senna tora]
MLAKIQDSMASPTAVGEQGEKAQSSDHPRSPDEIDNMKRSKKKIRKEEGSFSGVESRALREEEWMNEEKLEQHQDIKRMSYRDSVRGGQRTLDFEKVAARNDDQEEGLEPELELTETSSSEAEDETYEEGHNGITVEKDDLDRLNFTLHDKEWKRLSRPFRKSLIIKLLGKTVGFKFLLRKVNQLWGQTGEVELIDLGNDYFLAKFNTYTDQDFALTGGPWVILDHYLVIRPQDVLEELNRKIRNRIKRKKSDAISGSRFTVLNNDDDVEPEGNMEPEPQEIPINNKEEEKWEVSDHNPIFVDKSSQNVEVEEEPEPMILRTPTKPKGTQARSNEARMDVDNRADMGVSPINGKKSVSKQQKYETGGKPGSTSNTNRKEKPPDTSRKKNIQQKDQNAIIFWNCRGAAGKKFALAFKEIKRIHKPDAVFLFETRCSGLKAANTIKNLAFSHNELNEARGFMGGIWALWSQNINGTWDINEIADVTEQKGGSSPNSQRCRNFQNWINDCNLIDLKPSGLFFTWEGPKRPGQQKLYKRLDRVLCSASWRTTFVDASTKSITKIHSDHHPILVTSEDGNNNPGNRPFRFEECWMEHEVLKQFIKDNWQIDMEHHTMLDQLAAKLKNWNRNVFENIIQRKNRIMRRLHGIQEALDRKYNLFLSDLNKTLVKELEMVLDQEEVLWFQKARCQWIRDGDRNTSYYHTKAISRRRRNTILMLKNNDGNWTDEIEELKVTILEFFKSLFTEEKHQRHFNTEILNWPQIESHTWNAINVPFEDEEIRRAIFNIGRSKAPGSDGFTAGFYQQNCDIVSGSVLKDLKKLGDILEQISFTGEQPT